MYRRTRTPLRDVVIPKCEEAHQSSFNFSPLIFLLSFLTSIHYLSLKMAIHVIMVLHGSIESLSRHLSRKQLSMCRVSQY